MAIFKQSNIYIHQFLMVKSSDHITGASTADIGGVPTVKLGKNGATGAAAAGTVTVVDGTNLLGVYQIALTAVDTNTLGSLALAATGSNCDPTNEVHQVQSQIFPDLSLDANGNANISSNYKKNAATTLPFVMTLSSNNAPATGKTVVGQRNFGSGFTNISGSVSELGSGVYKATLLAADTNAAVVLYRFTEASCNDQDITIYTQP